VTLSKVQQIAVRGLYQDAGINAVAGQESSQAPRYLAELERKLQASGGEVPLPERLSSPLLAELRHLSGNKQLLKLAEAKDELKVTARLDAKTDAYLVELPSLQLKDVRISPELVSEHERMLTGGFYAELKYNALIAGEKNGRPFGVASLQPIQLSKRSALEEMAQGRAAFSTAEWKALLLRSVGFESSALVY